MFASANAEMRGKEHEERNVFLDDDLFATFEKNHV
jgi:hypothetical protein